MIRMIKLAIIISLICRPALSQSVRIVFGPLDGDSAGVLRTYEDVPVEMDIWLRIEPGLHLTGFHLPLSSNDEYIVSRNYGQTFPSLEGWEITFTDPEDDPINDGYTNQSILAVCNFLPDCENPIDAPEEWIKIGVFDMAAGPAPELDSTFCDAFLAGYDSDNGGIVVVDYYQGELDSSQVEVDFSCLRFEESCDQYIIGDYNGNGSVNVADLIDAYAYILTCAPEAAVLCQCPPGKGEPFAVAMDLNNSCTFNIADIFDFIRFFRDYPWLIVPCEFCPPD